MPLRLSTYSISYEAPGRKTIVRRNFKFRGNLKIGWISIEIIPCDFKNQRTIVIIDNES